VFVDRVEIFVKAGDGGRGMASFRREKYVPKGGPDGGDGGDGGSIIIRAVANADNLATIAHQKHYKAKSGEPGGSSQCSGRMAKDLILEVPPGTIVRDRDRGHVLKDLTEIGQQVTVAMGGRGGRGNKYFATSTNRAPREFEPGGEGEERWISLELKVIADVGLVGLPNAGKSTLLSRLSRARPEIADYPFTTKYPNLGMVSVGGDHHFVMADLPGLIEGAHSGVGLGHEFLRHVERTRVIIHLVEPFPTDGSDPLQNYRTIRNELELYSPALARKPEFVAVSKSELTESSAIRDQMASELGIEVEAISAVTGQGLAKLMSKVVLGLAAIPREQPPAESDFTRPKPEPIAIPTPGN
jgi:GTPase